MTEPFQINIAPAVIDDLKQKLAQTRWPDEIANDNWGYGTNRDYLQMLVFDT